MQDSNDDSVFRQRPSASTHRLSSTSNHGNGLGPSYLSGIDPSPSHLEDDIFRNYGEPSTGTLAGRKRSFESASSSDGEDDDDESDRDRRQSGVGGSQRKINKSKPRAKEEKDKDGKTGVRRATQACLRCRKQKLRCVGGDPCDRCVKSKNPCDFGRPVPGGMTTSQSRTSIGPEVATARLEQLESSVANLLAGLAGSNHSQAPNFPNGADVRHHFGSGSGVSNGLGGARSSLNGIDFDERHSLFDRLSSSGPTVGGGSNWSGISPTFNRPIDQISNLHPLQTHLGHTSSAEELGRQRVRFSTSPRQVLNHNFPLNSPSTHTSGQTPEDQHQASQHARTGRKPKKSRSKAQEPEERLAAVTEQVYDPPFKALAYDVSQQSATRSRESRTDAGLACRLGQS